MRFVDLCDQFRLPVANLVDQPGFVIGSDAERAGTMRRGARALFAVHQATVPWVSVLVRKVYGVAGAVARRPLAAQPPLRLAVGRLGLAADRRRARGRLPARARGGRGPGRAARRDRGAARRGALAVPHRRALRRRGDHRPARHAPAAVRVGAPGSPPRRPRGRRRAEGARAPPLSDRYRGAMTEHAFHADDVDVSPKDVKARHDAGEIQLIDVREDYEHEAGRIAGARHIELERVASQAPTIDKDRPVVFYCRLGARSGMAANAFRRAGWDAYSMDGGIAAWDARRPAAGAHGRACRGPLERSSRSSCSRSQRRQAPPPHRASCASATSTSPSTSPRRRTTASGCSSSSGAGWSASSATAPRSPRPSSTSPPRSAPPRTSAGCSRSPSRPTTSAPGSSTST